MHPWHDVYIDEIQRFFEDYKALEHKEVIVEGMRECEEALQSELSKG
jgi:inorganic pyrophosphatase